MIRPVLLHMVHRGRGEVTVHTVSRGRGVQRVAHTANMGTFLSFDIRPGESAYAVPHYQKLCS